MKKIDLHVHTRCSDGNLTVKEILALAQKNNLSTISITDHETIINLINHRDLEKEYKINIIPGIELPTDIPKMHILGYGIKNIEYLEKIMINLRKENEERNKETIDILYKNGINITYNKVKELTSQEIITYRDIVKYLYAKGYVNDPRNAYQKYIGKGCKAYVPSKTLTEKEVLELIQYCNGIPVLAHPFTINQSINIENLIKNMKKNGLEGIEIYPPKITKKQLEYYEYLLKKYKLIKTIGSDFHNSNYDELGVEVNDNYMKNITKKLKRGKVEYEK